MIKTTFRGGLGGGFNYADFYKQIIDQLPDNSVIAEIGVWDGESTVFMAEFIRDSGKNIMFYAIDPFCPFLIDDVWHQANLNVFLNNIEPVRKHVKLMVMDSVNAANEFDDHSCDFVFIDANHEYPYPKIDIEAWKSKIKVGGILAGHDYADGVKQAVDETFTDIEIFPNTVWLTRL